MEFSSLNSAPALVPHAISLSLQDWFHSSSSVLPQVLLMDGGVSTHLENIISPKSFCNRSLWSSSLLLSEEGRDFIVRGHQDWLSSGCDILTTVTYQCHYGLVQADVPQNPSITRGCKNNLSTAIAATATEAAQGLNKEEGIGSDEMQGLDATKPTQFKMREMMVDGIFLARKAIKERTEPRRLTSFSTPFVALGPFVVASTGPYGAAMADGSEYTGKYPPHVTREALVCFHSRKAHTLLVEGKPDGIAVETIPNLQEVGVVCEVLRDLQQRREDREPPVACWVSLACRNGNELNDGHTIEEALRLIQLHDPNGKWITAVGINCCDSAFIASLVRTLIRVDGGRRSIVIYPNSGENWDAANEDWTEGSGATDHQIADRLMEAISIIRDAFQTERTSEALAETNKEAPKHRVPKIVIGGCCRTNPATMVLLREKIDSMNIDT